MSQEQRGKRKRQEAESEEEAGVPQCLLLEQKLILFQNDLQLVLESALGATMPEALEAALAATLPEALEAGLAATMPEALETAFTACLAPLAEAVANIKHHKICNHDAHGVPSPSQPLLKV